MQRLTVHAIRDIKNGEQVTACYTNSPFMNHADRKKHLDEWDFSCSCEACLDSGSDVLRTRMRVLNDGLSAYRYYGGDLLDEGPKTANDAVRDSEELAGMLVKQGIVGLDLSLAYVLSTQLLLIAYAYDRYQQCAKLCHEARLPQKALEYARKALEVERCAIGTETKFLRDAGEGSEYLIDCLEGKIPMNPATGQRSW
ncbi:uncharacterized protein BCR38DRAFT_453309 [Pseudomassariella vexata]|uniref:SET domain-containing protein n=1 Tax=Pseudomassariella vexata TaxID=1141098 RepID=A0A1Y2D7U3_9PEZI|nr:uncharacterized protein BCR38DRAFT_453309 [Pseudomassariella vexata]ORY54705.1 hypothetical protein BCR38DRAFT_453309 [Pseudomassariella vexata]